ncbi:probable cytochrome P450 6a14 [Neodiprion virginianus]|uniref:probable cytochrome P450 6a14 n=1 Tax=Neodiprion virginianus TaxID=2961670 RepID=UPI001EE73602|nr:probable cytochrome P450 6a14 [Neodiprion virginianus]
MQLMNKGYIKNDDERSSAAVPDDREEKITMLQGAAQTYIFWVDGFDTSSSTMTHCLYELALHREIQDKLAEEINDILEEFGSLSYQSVKAIPYLHNVVSETLRKYPVTPILNRECIEEIELPGTGHRITKGTPLIIPVFGLHSDPEIYPEPEKFNPEKFSEENIAQKYQYAYLPFGEGPWNCTKVGLVSLLSKYRFTLGPDVKVPLMMVKTNFVQVPANGVTLRIQMR